MKNMSERDLQELVESFALFDTWEDRYRYLIDLGGRVEPLDTLLKTDESLVKGCTSRVWLVAGVKDGIFHFVADSDAKIVKGLIHVLEVAYQDKTIPEVLAVDIDAAFSQLGLDQHLSPNRRNGFFSMVEKIKVLAQAS